MILMQKNNLITLCAVCFVSVLGQAQNTGIGISNPTRARLEVNGMVGNTTAIFGSEANGIGLVASFPYLEYNGYYNNGHRYINNGYAASQYLDPGTGQYVISMSANGLKDATLTGSRSTISFASNGRMGIGQSPTYNAQLNVFRDAGKDCSAFFSAPHWSAFNYSSSEYTAIRNPNAQSDLYLNYYPLNSKIVMGSGTSNVGINWGSPVYPLEIHHNDFGVALMRAGNLNHWIMTVSQYYFKFFFRSTTANNALTQLGVFDYTTGQYSASSDNRVKKDVEALPASLDKLKKLTAYRYQMKNNNPGHDETIGLVAQEVKEVFPFLVHVTDSASTGYKNINDLHLMNYSGFAPLLIKALQEQEAQLQALEKRVGALEK
jgi:hypothetical protein